MKKAPPPAPAHNPSPQPAATARPVTLPANPIKTRLAAGPRRLPGTAGRKPKHGRQTSRVTTGKLTPDKISTLPSSAIAKFSRAQATAKLTLQAPRRRLRKTRVMALAAATALAISAQTGRPSAAAPPTPATPWAPGTPATPLASATPARMAALWAPGVLTAPAAPPAPLTVRLADGRAISPDSCHEPPGAKALHNQDIVAMKKANLGDDLIVVAIEHTPARFTTTPEALIALKNAGIGDSVLAAMLRAAGAQTTAVQDSEEATAAAAHAAESDGQPGLKLIRDDGLRLPGREQRMQRAACILIGPSALKAMLPGLARTTTSVFPGPRAAVRVATPTPTFEATYPTDLSIPSAIVLFRLDAFAGRRELKRPADPSQARSWHFRQAEDPIHLAIQQQPPDAAGSRRQARFRVRPLAPLPPGEYALLLGPANDYYDFGVDR